MTDRLIVPQSRYQSLGEQHNTLPGRQFYFLKKPNSESATPTPQFATGSFLLSSGTGTQAITGVGFEPTGVIMYGASNASLDTGEGQAQPCIGFGDGTTQKLVSAISRDSVTTSNTNVYAGSDSIFNIRNVANGNVLTDLHLDSLDSDGFTVDKTINSLDSFYIQYVVFGGGLECEVGAFNAPGSGTGVQNVATGIDTADFTMILNPFVAAEDASQNKYHLGVGIATDSNQGEVVTASQDNQATTNSYRYQRTDKMVTSINPTDGSVSSEAEFDGHTSSGFDLDWIVAPGGEQLYYLQVKGGQWEVGSDSSPASTTGVQAHTTAFEPIGMMTMSYGHEPLTTSRGDVRFQISAMDGTNENIVAAIDVDNLDTSQTDKYTSLSKCFVSVSAGAIPYTTGEFDSFNATDFSIDWTLAGGVALEFLWFVVGDAA